MRKNSTVRASAKELGGMMQWSPLMSTKDLGSKFFGIDDGAVDVGEQLEFVRAADVVAVAGGAVGHDAATVHLLDVARLERLDHAVLLRHAADPAVGFDAHRASVRCSCESTIFGKRGADSPAAFSAILASPLRLTCSDDDLGKRAL